MVVTIAFHMYWYGDCLTHIGRYSLKPGGYMVTNRAASHTAYLLCQDLGRICDVCLNGAGMPGKHCMQLPSQ